MNRIALFAALLFTAVPTLAATPVPPPAKGTKVDAAPTGKKGEWVELSVTMQDRKCNIAGLAVDRSNGDVFILPMHRAPHEGGGKGIWKSTDHAATFVKVDDNDVTGGGWNPFTMDMDPAGGGRLAVFCMYGRCGLTQDGGRTWRRLTQIDENAVGTQEKGADWGSVDWGDPIAATMMQTHHERTPGMYLSADGGKSWQPMKFGARGLGVFDASAVIVFEGGGIQRSEDLGKTWVSVSKERVRSSVVRKLKDKGYLMCDKGLLVTADKGKTWAVQGAPIDDPIAWDGPYFGKDENHILVVGGKGIYESTDAAATWKLALPLPAAYAKKQFKNTSGDAPFLGYDPATDIFYIAFSNQPAFRYER